MEKRFRSLRAIATVLKILAWVALIGGILGGIFIFVAGLAGGLAGSSASLPVSDMGLGGVVAGVLGGFLVIVGALLYFLFLYAAGDAIYLALAIEQNTRETAYYLKGGESPRQTL
jgi:hypothetical protein